VGIVGAGQLARMMHRAAIDLGVRVEVLADDPADPAVTAGAAHRRGRPDDLSALRALARGVEVVTFDHELVDLDHVAALVADGVVVRPGPAALAAGVDKLLARRRLAGLGFPVPAFREVGVAGDVSALAAACGWPLVLKARRGGYDGRGVVVVHGAEEAAAVLAGGGSWIAEAHVPIARELSVLVVRSPTGDQRAYPVVETVQRDGVCTELVLPAPVAPSLATSASRLAMEVVSALGAVGVVAVELFVTPSGDVVVNELALRPHNSGHATIEACTTSQFHNHLRAVLGWPLGATDLRVPAAATVNVLGPPAGRADGEPLASSVASALAVPGVSVHLYGKLPRPGRKLAHVTAVGDTADQARHRARRAAGRLGRAWGRA
jgi:5-(carboxyamino)imidazole ribonucleotide synthase